MIKSDRPLYDDTPSDGAPVSPAPADEALKMIESQNEVEALIVVAQPGGYRVLTTAHFPR